MLQKESEEKYPIRKLATDEFPRLLSEIPDPPKHLYVRGELPTHTELRYLCVVGSRKYSPYGKSACETLIAGLAGFPVVIVSGLALGIDSIAHTAALDAGLTTVAIPGSGLGWNVLHPSSHLTLAKHILKKSGALLSEFEESFKATPFSFPQRNRIMAGMSHAVLVIEARAKSGTLITSRLATEYNRDVFTIPHMIFSGSGEGPHLLLSLGAAPIRTSNDILTALGLEHSNAYSSKHVFETLSPDEQKVAELLTNPLSRDELIASLDMPIQHINILLSAMQLKGLIVETMGEMRMK